MASPPLQTYVVICGNDELLLRTRKLVLENAGFLVTTVVGLSALASLREEREIDLLLLCHSLDVSGMREGSQIIDDRWPASRMLAITTHYRGKSKLSIPSVDAFAGPLAMVEACRKLASGDAGVNFRVTGRRDDEIVGG